MDELNCFNPYLMNREFSTSHAKVKGFGGSQIATLSLSIPTRKKFIDRRGRVRRVAVKFELPLIGGIPGAMDARTAISNFTKAIKKSGPRPLTQQLFKRICTLYNSVN